MNKLTEKEAIEVRVALENYIHTVNKRIHECNCNDELRQYINYWTNTLKIVESAHKKLCRSILFMAGD